MFPKDLATPLKRQGWPRLAKGRCLRVYFHLSRDATTCGANGKTVIPEEEAEEDEEEEEEEEEQEEIKDEDFPLLLSGFLICWHCNKFQQHFWLFGLAAFPFRQGEER